MAVPKGTPKLGPVVGYLAVLGSLLVWWTRAESRSDRIDSAALLPPEWRWTTFRSREGAVLGITLFALACVQLALAEQWPLLSGLDEPVAAAVQMWDAKAWAVPPGNTGARVAFFFSLAGLASALPAAFCSLRGASVSRWKHCLLALFLFTAGLGLYFWAHGVLHGHSGQAPSGPVLWGHSRRWPPVGTLVGTLSHSLFGYNEVAAQLPAILFYLSTGIYLYRIGCNTGSFHHRPRRESRRRGLSPRLRSRENLLAREARSRSNATLLSSRQRLVRSDVADRPMPRVQIAATRIHSNAA